MGEKVLGQVERGERDGPNSMLGRRFASEGEMSMLKRLSSPLRVVRLLELDFSWTWDEAGEEAYMTVFGDTKCSEVIFQPLSRPLGV